MAKYLILYNAPEKAGEFMAQSTPEQIAAGRAAWIAWKDEATKSVGFEFGSPVQVVGRVTSAGVEESDTIASGYSIMESDSQDAVMEALANHPHLKRPQASIDVLEMLEMKAGA